jgi:hypothetical protein
MKTAALFLAVAVAPVWAGLIPYSFADFTASGPGFTLTATGQSGAIPTGFGENIVTAWIGSVAFTSTPLDNVSNGFPSGAEFVSLPVGQSTVGSASGFLDLLINSILVGEFEAGPGQPGTHTMDWLALTRNFLPNPYLIDDQPYLLSFVPLLPDGCSPAPCLDRGYQFAQGMPGDTVPFSFQTDISLSQTPEPSTWALLCVGLCLALARRCQMVLRAN